jgi:adenosylhomocysteine nucleosidase
MPETAMVAALEHELWPLVKHWRVSRREYAGRSFRFFEGERSVAVCGGVGAEAARRATEAIIALYHPLVVQSVGFAGALEGGLRVGKVLEPRYVVDAGDGSRVDTGHGADVLVSFSSVAGKDQKSNLAGAYGAQAVDMEAAAVARGAQARGLRFRAVKVISDELGFEMPSLDPFVGRDGSFRAGKFALHAAVRPWLWGSVLRLARNSAKASRALSEYLRHMEQSRTDSGALPAALGNRGGQ